jgi:hypothetical protein
MLPPIARLFKRTGVKVAFILILGACLLFFLPASTPNRLSQYITLKRKSGLSYGGNGLAHGWIPGARVHPIEELMAKGKAKWEDLINR